MLQAQIWPQQSAASLITIGCDHWSADRDSQADAIWTPLGTYRTKLKLDKEVGGGDLAELHTITQLVAYPYA